MLNVGAGEIMLIMVAALLLLGPKRLPEMARAIGKFMREFRRQTDDVRGLVEREFYRMDEEIVKPLTEAEHNLLAPNATSHVEDPIDPAQHPDHPDHYRDDNPPFQTRALPPDHNAAPTQASSPVTVDEVKNGAEPAAEAVPTTQPVPLAVSRERAKEKAAEAAAAVAPVAGQTPDKVGS